jgi:hypothetical protein
MHHSDDLLPVPIESAWQISPLKRCLEALKIAREIGVSDAMWLVERAVKSYMQAAGPNYTHKMISLEALKSSWREQRDATDADSIWDFIAKCERDLREMAERLLQEIDTPTSTPTTVPVDQSDLSPVRRLWRWPFRGNAPIEKR